MDAGPSLRKWWVRFPHALPSSVGVTATHLVLNQESAGSAPARSTIWRERIVLMSLMSAIDMAVYMRERRANRRKRLIDMLGGLCDRCDSDEGLEFDHVDPSTKLFTLSGKSLDKPWSVIVAEAKKCQILCTPCHKAKTKRESPCPHGSWRHRKYGCNCDVCLADDRDARDRYNAARRLKRHSEVGKR